jgi:hypothetical protein
MHSRTPTVLRFSIGVVLGCAVAFCPIISASAQAGGTGVLAVTHPETTEQGSRNRWVPDDRDGGTVVSASNDVATTSKPWPPLTRGADAVEQRRVAQQYVSEKLAIWKEILKLNDWQVFPSMTRLEDLKPRTVGQIHWDKDRKTAAISVLDPIDYPLHGQAMLDDMELTIVHELVHLKLASLPRSEASRGSEEQAVNGISEALFALEHKK